MSLVLKMIKTINECMELHIEHCAFKHPYLFFFELFIGMPVCALAAAFFFAVIITVPIALVFGWL